MLRAWRLWTERVRAYHRSFRREEPGVAAEALRDTEAAR
jgi:hypothetical protein